LPLDVVGLSDTLNSGGGGTTDEEEGELAVVAAAANEEDVDSALFNVYDACNGDALSIAEGASPFKNNVVLRGVSPFSPTKTRLPFDVLFILVAEPQKARF